MAQLTRKPDKYPYNISKDDFQTVNPKPEGPTDEPRASGDSAKAMGPSTKVRGDNGMGRGPKDRKKSPY